MSTPAKNAQVERHAYPHIMRCANPETCEALHNDDVGQGPDHHYGCECSDCAQAYWFLKH